MKLTLLLTLLLNVSVWATGFSQVNRVTLQMRDVSLEKIILQLREQTGIRFFYSVDKIKDIHYSSIDVNDERLDKVLDNFLEGTGLTYVLLDDVIVIKDGLQKKADEVDKQIVLRGVVKAMNGETLPGVTIVIKGTKVGVSSDTKGEFLLSVLNKDTVTLVFSYVGMKTKEVQVDLRKELKPLNVIMEDDAYAVDEVVVTGYQEVKRKGMAGSIGKINADDLVITGANTLEQMLQGLDPGLMVINRSGLTGTRQKVRVRGTSTLVGNADPVWVVDGIIQQDPLPFEARELTDMSDENIDMIKNFVGSAISWLNPRDIQDITILKDASATAIYGVRAANGVIVITTRKGERGRLSMSYSGDFNMGDKLNYKRMELMNSKQRVDISREAYERGARVFDEEIGYMALALAYQRRQISYEEFDRGAKELEAVNTDWFDILFQYPFTHSHTVSISGGDQKSTYYASLGYSSIENTAKGNSQTSYNARMSISSIFWDRLSVNLSLSGAHTETKAFAAGVDPFNYVSNTNRAIPCYDEEGAPFFYLAGDYRYNILNELKHSGNRNKLRSLNVAANLSWNVLDCLILSTTLGGGTSTSLGRSWFTEQSYNITRVRGYEFQSYTPLDAAFKMSALPYGGLLSISENESFNYTWRLQGEFVKIFGKHSVNFMGGIEASSNEREGLTQKTFGYMPERGETFANLPLIIENGSVRGMGNMLYRDMKPVLVNSINNVFSYYLTANYMYDERYALNLSVRSDGSNRFGQDARTKFLPVWSAGLRWNVTDEPWLAEQNILNNLSIIASFGYQGNVVEAVSPDLITKIMPVEENTGEYRMTYSKLPTPDLTWEKTKSINLGLNFSVLKSRINTSFEYYYKKTTDLITKREVPQANGVSSTYVNGGHMKNSGWELALSLVPVRAKDFVWNLGINTSKVYNKITSKLSPSGRWQDVVDGTFNKEGYPVSSFWAFRFTGLDPQNGGPLFDLASANTNAAELDVTQYMVHAGKLDPDLTAGINMSFRYKTLTLGTSFYMSTGNQAFLSSPYKGAGEAGYGMPSEYENASSQLTKRWRKPGDEEWTNIPSIPVGENCLPLRPFKNNSNRLYPYQAWAFSDVRVVDAWYIRCNSITLSYMVPEKVIRGFAQNVNCSFTVSNPFQIVSRDFDGRDSEVAKGSQPLNRSFSLSLNVSF